MSQWPAVIDESFWPIAIRHAVNVYNHTTRNGAATSPWELFTGESSNLKLTNYHVFGSPVYVLHKTLQDSAGSRHKWKSNCWQGIYLGQSPMHAGNVALVYNFETTHVSPQFHVTFDDTFSSVAASTPDAADSAIKALLDKTAWLYSDAYESPTSLHYFLQPEASPQGPSFPDQQPATVPSQQPNNSQMYKTVRSSQAFDEWKRVNGIAADVFAPVPLPGISPGSLEGVSRGRPPGSSEGTLRGHQPSSSKGAPEGGPLGPLTSSSEGVFEGVPPRRPPGSSEGGFPGRSSGVSEGVSHESAPTPATPPSALVDVSVGTLDATSPSPPERASHPDLSRLRLNVEDWDPASDPAAPGDHPPWPYEGVAPIHAYPATPATGNTLTQSAMLKVSDQAEFVKA
jgi:hypothetical protein